MMIFVLASTLFFGNALGIPLLNSTVGSDVSGEVCPGSVTFVCNALNFGANGFIAWFINDSQLALYMFRNDDDFPYTVTFDTSILNATVQISSSTFESGQYSFANFTLTTDINNLHSLQEQNITCGTNSERSNIISINNFTILEREVQNVSYEAKYQGPDGALAEIYVKWIDGFKLANCEVITDYTIMLITSEEVTSRTLTTKDCSNSQCFEKFNSSHFNNAAENYKLQVQAYNQWNEGNFTSSIIPNTTGNVINSNTCNDTALITCSITAGGNCSINSSNALNSTIIMPNGTFTVTHLQDIEVLVEINFNSTSLIQTISFFSDERTNNGDRFILGVGVSMTAFGFLLYILGCVVGAIIFFKCQTKFNKDYWFIWKVTFILSIAAMIIFIITLVLWIVVGVTPTKDICGIETGYSKPVLYVAAALSFILCIFGAMVLGGFIISHKLNENKAQVPQYTVKFGKEKPATKTKESNKCSNCCMPKIAGKAWKKCTTCNMNVCEDCFSKTKVYIKFCKKDQYVCGKCYKNYQDERNKVSGFPFSYAQPPEQKNRKQCHECRVTEDENAKKHGLNTSTKLSSCTTCGYWVCKKCIDEHKVEVRFLQQNKKKIKKQVCINCFAIYKMTATNETSL